MTARQAVVLVGGKGTRLGNLASKSPKPLMPLDDTTVFLDEVLLDIVRHGYNDVILAAGHLGDQVASRYDQTTFKGATLRVVVEPAPAGTGGALQGVAEFLDPIFLLANGDTAFDFNLRRLDTLFSATPDALGILGLRRVADGERYGSVILEGQHIIAFREKASTGGDDNVLISGGVGLFRRELVDLIDELPCSIETQIYPRLARERRLLGQEFEGYFLDIGLPETLARARQDLASRRRRAAVFFDRDGVINRDAGYTWRIEDLQFIPGAIETIRAVNDMGALAIVVTNQAGIARGFYTYRDVDRFHAAIQGALAQQGAHIDAFYVCAHHPDAAVPNLRHADHPDRKPNPGMILQAMRDWPVDPALSLLVGDKDTDIVAARRAGITGIRFDGGNLYEDVEPSIRRLNRASTAVLR